MQPYILKGPVYNEDGEVVCIATRDILRGELPDPTQFEGLPNDKTAPVPRDIALLIDGAPGYWQKRQVGG